MAKTKKLILIVILTSLLGFVEWGDGQGIFLFRIEFEVLSRLFENPILILNPLIVLPLLGQQLLIFSLFQDLPKRLLINIGIIGLGVLLLMIFIMGVFELKYKMAISALPFMVASYLLLRYMRRLKK